MRNSEETQRESMLDFSHRTHSPSNDSNMFSLHDAESPPTLHCPLPVNHKRSENALRLANLDASSVETIRNGCEAQIYECLTSHGVKLRAQNDFDRCVLTSLLKHRRNNTNNMQE